MPLAKKGERFGGRGKGVPNKVTFDVRKMINRALERAGGEDYLLRQAKANPVAFMSLVGKIIPKVIIGQEDNPIVISVEDRRAAALLAIERAFAQVAQPEALEGPKVIDAEVVEMKLDRGVK